MKRMSRDRRRKSEKNLRLFAFSGSGLLAAILLIGALFWLEDNGLRKIPLELKENTGRFIFYDALENPSQDSSTLMPLDPKSEKKGTSAPRTKTVKPDLVRTSLPPVKVEKSESSHVAHSNLKTYAVQVAALRDKSVAGEVVSEFIQKGYDAYLVAHFSPGEGRWYRVRVGHFEGKREAKEMAERISRKERISGFVVVDTGSRE